MRTFDYTFEPVADDPVGANIVALDVQGIEDAGLKEVLQTPEAPYGSWKVLEALLHPTGHGSPFLFREALGRSREVKVALSGLFGRFVARAYLEQYHGLTVFSHVALGPLTAAGRRIAVQRRERGDLPDWIACSGVAGSLTIAEAKGCHNSGGPGRTLARAWAQANRVGIEVRHRFRRLTPGHLTVERIAVVTRWGSAVGGAPATIIAVKDPVEKGNGFEQADEDAAIISLHRRHMASLLRPLGFYEIADELLVLDSDSADRREGARGQLLDRIASFGCPSIDLPQLATVRDHDLIGSVVTSMGSLERRRVIERDLAVLRKLDLRPKFVGVEREMLKAATLGDLPAIRQVALRGRLSTDRARADSAGVWIADLG